MRPPILGPWYLSQSGNWLYTTGTKAVAIPATEVEWFVYNIVEESITFVQKLQQALKLWSNFSLVFQFQFIFRCLSASFRHNWPSSTQWLKLLSPKIIHRSFRVFLFTCAKLWPFPIRQEYQALSVCNNPRRKLTDNYCCWFSTLLKRCGTANFWVVWW